MLSFASRILPGIAANSADYRVARNDTLAIGFDLSIGDPPIWWKWAGFEGDFTQGNDWAVAIDGKVVQTFLDQQVEELLRRINADAEPITRILFSPGGGAVTETMAPYPANVKSRGSGLSSPTAVPSRSIS